MALKKSLHVRVRLVRRTLVPDGYGGFQETWHPHEERWGTLHHMDRFLPSLTAMQGIEDGVLPKKRALYGLKLKSDPERKPFERFSWKKAIFSVLSEDVTIADKGYDFFWACRYLEEEQHEESSL